MTRKPSLAAVDNTFESYPLTKFIGIISGLIIIIFIFWNRLLRERLPRDLINQEPSSLLYYCILLTAITLFFTSVREVVIAYRHYYGITKPNKYVVKVLENKYVKKTLIYLGETSVFSFLYIYIYLFPYHYILNGPRFLIKRSIIWIYVTNRSETGFGAYFRGLLYRFGYFVAINHFSHDFLEFLFRHQITVFFFVYLPRIICFSIFLVDVAINKYIENFYHYAILLLIPYIFELIRYTLEYAALYEKYYLEEYIIDIDKSDPEKLYNRHR